MTNLKTQIKGQFTLYEVLLETNWNSWIYLASIAIRVLYSVYIG